MRRLITLVIIVSQVNGRKTSRPISRGSYIDIPIGVDALPEYVKRSPLFSGKLLARLTSVEEIPEEEEIEELRETYTRLSTDDMLKICAKLVEEGRVLEAWQVLYMAKII